MSWIHAVVDVPGTLHAAVADFWSRALGWPAGDPWPGHPELRSFEPPAGTTYVHLQQVDGPPRVHLDVESGHRAETVSAATRLGAEPVGRSETWQTMRSPGGLPFCVLSAADHVPPPPVTHPDGHRTRLVQVCLDLPRQRQAAEVEFWQGLLDGRRAPSHDPEFAGKWHDDQGSPIQLLFQVLDEAEGPVRAHLDLGTDDLPAEVSRLLDLGATDVGPGRGWHVLRDPAGLPFCVTPNSPEQTRLRDLG